MKTAITSIKQNISTITAYMSTAYYIEIIYMMFIISMLAGKTIAIITGALLSILLAVHSISIYQKKTASRVIQLFIMDIHAAIAVVSLKSFLQVSITHGAADTFIVIFRTVFFFVEIALIFLLTTDETAKLFNKSSRDRTLPGHG